MATKELRIGMIGYGFMGRAHSNAYRKVSNFFDLEYRPVLKAACARNAEQVKAFADRNPLIDRNVQAIAVKFAGRQKQGQSTRLILPKGGILDHLAGWPHERARLRPPHSVCGKLLLSPLA